MRLTLDYPPSANRYWRVDRGVIHRSIEANAYRDPDGDTDPDDDEDWTVEVTCDFDDDDWDDVVWSGENNDNNV